MKAAIFDLDGTITASETLHLKTFNRVFGKFGVTLSAKEWVRFKGEGAKEIFSTVFKENKIKEDIDKWVRVRSRFFHDEVKKGNLKKVKGFDRFFSLLKKESIDIIIASSGHYSNVVVELKALGLWGEKFICARDVKKLKPNPAIFLKAVKILGKDVGDCVVFEDSIAGVKAAKNAKMYCVCVGDCNGLADLAVKDFRKLGKRKVKELFF